MKATGIVRPVDSLGRIVIPKELRRTLGINVGDPMDILVDGDSIILRKYDTVGDLEQLIDSVEKTISAKDAIASPKLIRALLSKTEEMRDIINAYQE